MNHRKKLTTSSSMRPLQHLTASRRFVILCWSQNWLLATKLSMCTHVPIYGIKITTTREIKNTCKQTCEAAGVRVWFVCSLQEFNTSHCMSDVMDEGIQSVVTQCPRLSILVSHGCPLLTRQPETLPEVEGGWNNSIGLHVYWTITHWQLHCMQD